MANHKKQENKKIFKANQANKKNTTKGSFAWSAQQWQKIKSTWQSYPDPVHYLIMATVTGSILLFMWPQNNVNSEENPLGIKTADLSVGGMSTYSAEPIVAYSNVESPASGSSIAEMPVSDVGITKSEASTLPMAQQEAEYEAYFESLQESRRINGKPTSLPPINNMTLSSGSQTLASASSSSSQISSYEASDSADASAGTVPESNTYTVQRGDNLYRIGVNHGLSLEGIMALNGMSVPEVTPGQILRVQ